MAEGSLKKNAAKKVAAKKIAAKKGAAKQAGKKAAKKTPKSAGHEARRAYEHLHRVQILHEQVTGDALLELETLSRFAQAAFVAEEPRSAADLLRAAEHLAFGALATEDADEAVAGELKDELRAELEHQLERARERWEDLDEKPARDLRQIYKGMRTEAKAAWKSKAYHRALEFARAAGALASARPQGLRLSKGDGEDAALLPSSTER